ncbi:MAG: hypothetical protein Q8R36_01150 [bacterium]|nr:hypothetical protein [bacterium]
MEKPPQYFEFKTSEVISEKDYIEAASSYALESGWIKPEQKATLIEQYLQPIYKKYKEIIEDVKKEIADEEGSEEMMRKIIYALNYYLFTTRRIGTTDPNNIMLEIKDLYRMRASVHNYMEYALASLKEHIQDLLNL